MCLCACVPIGGSIGGAVGLDVDGTVAGHAVVADGCGCYTVASIGVG